jgi:hypothetical protein
MNMNRLQLWSAVTSNAVDQQLVLVASSMPAVAYGTHECAAQVIASSCCCLRRGLTAEEKGYLRGRFLQLIPQDDNQVQPAVTELLNPGS